MQVIFFMGISCKTFHEKFFPFLCQLNLTSFQFKYMMLAPTGSYWGWRRCDGWWNGTTDLCTTYCGGNRSVDGRRKTAPSSASPPGVCQIRIIHMNILRTESQWKDLWTFWTDGVYILLNIISVLKGKDSNVFSGEINFLLCLHYFKIFWLF